MGKRYYCDFCDKSFADSPQNRKNHMSGGQHQRMRKAHYDLFRDPAAILSAELSLRPCRAFRELGSCDFGERCRFSHLTEERKRQLEQEMARAEEEKQRRESSEDVDPNVTVEDWLAKRAGKQPSTAASSETKVSPLPEPVMYSLPPSLQGIPNLPPPSSPSPHRPWLLTGSVGLKHPLRSHAPTFPKRDETLHQGWMLVKDASHLKQLT